MIRKICVVTGTRADYGLLYWVMRGIHDNPGLSLQIIATGMHLSPEFGLTYHEIEKDGFIIDDKVEMLLSSDSPIGLSKSMGLGMIGFGESLQRLRPDLLLVLGDRFEIFSVVAAAMIARIPIAHLHGGETTEGAFDEAIRHSITKMSHLHFVAAEEYKNRVIQLGESPERVFQVGGLGVDSIKRLRLLSRTELEKSIGFKFGDKNILVTFHPVTLENSTASEQMLELLKALEKLSDTRIIFTFPNADTDSRILIKLVDAFVSNNKNSIAFTSLGHLRYISCIKYVDVVLGNSSSGLMEVPSFRKGTVNIGDRQQGRLKAESVVDCLPEHESILNALDKIYSKKFIKKLKSVTNPYGDGGASDKIVEIIRTHPLSNILKKSFYSLKF